MSRSWAALRLAVGTLTVWPVRHVVPAREITGRAMLLAPVAVLPVALAAALVARGVTAAGWPPPLAGVAAVAVLTAGTRALHLDGLADTVDGLGSGADPDRALAIMRRGDVGPMGVVALVLVLGAQVVAAASLSTTWADALVLVLAVCASRVAVALACRRGLPPARPEGLGAAVAGSVAPAWVPVSAAAHLLLLTGALTLAHRPWWLGPVALVAALGAGETLLRHCRRRFGGVTGDVIGAAVEVALTVLLVVAILPGGPTGGHR